MGLSRGMGKDFCGNGNNWNTELNRHQTIIRGSELLSLRVCLLDVNVYVAVSRLESFVS